jgi:hypothetical protein
MKDNVSSVILLKSITEAHKAKRQLSNYRIKSSVEKIQRSEPMRGRQGGCCYGIRIYSDPKKICRLLETVNVHCEEVIQ